MHVVAARAVGVRSELLGVQGLDRSGGVTRRAEVRDPLAQQLGGVAGVRIVTTRALGGRQVSSADARANRALRGMAGSTQPRLGGQHAHAQAGLGQIRAPFDLVAEAAVLLCRSVDVRLVLQQHGVAFPTAREQPGAPLGIRRGERRQRHDSRHEGADKPPAQPGVAPVSPRANSSFVAQAPLAPSCRRACRACHTRADDRGSQPGQTVRCCAARVNAVAHHYPAPRACRARLTIHCGDTVSCDILCRVGTQERVTFGGDRGRVPTHARRTPGWLRGAAGRR